MKRLIMSIVAAITFGAFNTTVAQAQSLTMGTCGTGGGWYQAGTLMSAVISRKVEGLDINAVPTECAAFNLVALGRERLDLGFTTSNLARSAMLGEDQFGPAGTEGKIRALFSYSVSYLHIFTLDPAIQEITDLQGKRVAVGSPASSTYQQAIAVLEAAGMDPQQDLELVQVNVATGVEQLRGGQIDAHFWSSALDVPSMLELVNSRETHFLEVPDEVFERIPAELALSEVEMPAGAYPTIDTSYPTLGIYSIMVTTTNLDDEVARKFVSGYFENLDEIRAGLPATAEVATRETALDGLLVPLHPGARAYFEAEGFPGLEEFDARLQADGVVN